MEWTLANSKDLAAIVQSVATVVALCFGGYWTYKTFMGERANLPKANMSNGVTFIKVGPTGVVVRVTIAISNIGKSLLNLQSLKVQLYQVVPLLDDVAELEGRDTQEFEWREMKQQRRMDWPKGDREIEPGESDEEHFDFLLDPCPDLIQVYSYLENHHKKKEIGWRKTNIYSTMEEAHV